MTVEEVADMAYELSIQSNVYLTYVVGTLSQMRNYKLPSRI